jgi:hypothetical protein
MASVQNANYKRELNVSYYKKEIKKLIDANMKLQQESETANNRADKNYGLYKEYERKFLEVSSYCACQKKAVGK